MSDYIPFDLDDAVNRDAVGELADEIRRLYREVQTALDASRHTCDEYGGCGACELETLAVRNGTLVCPP